MRFAFTVPMTGHRVEVAPAPAPHVFRFPDQPTKQALVDEAVRLGIRRDFYRLTNQQIRQLIASR